MITDGMAKALWNDQDRRTRIEILEAGLAGLRMKKFGVSVLDTIASLRWENIIGSDQKQIIKAGFKVLGMT